MSILADAFRAAPRASTPDPLSDFWYSSDPSGYMVERSISGLGLSADTIMKCSTVYGAVAFRGDSWAMCPPSTYRKTATGRKEESGHYSQLVLRNPNKTQTGNRWRNLNGVWMATWGNAYNELVAGPRSFVDELRPMHPSRVRLVDQRGDGSLVYAYREPGGGTERILGQERVLHFRDLSMDGLSGMPMYQLIRNVVGIALLAERHASTFLAKGARISGLLVPANPLNPEQRKELRESVNSDMGGPSNTGTFGILPSGVELKEITRTHRESQFIELSDLIVGSILRFLRVPGVVVGYSKDLMGYASAKEFFESGGIKHCVLPILTNVEAEEEKTLLPDGSGLQIKHNLDALLRANLKDRYDAYSKALGGAPFLSVNDVRATEDWDEDPDPKHSEIRIPTNLLPKAEEPNPDDETEAPGGKSKRSTTADEDEDPEMAKITRAARVLQQTYLTVGVIMSNEEARKLVTEAGFPLPGSMSGPRKVAVAPGQSGGAEQAESLGVEIGARARWLAETAARQQLRREGAALSEKAPKFARNPEKWDSWMTDYYERSVAHVGKAFNVSEREARLYCDRQAERVRVGGVAVVEQWETEVLPELVALALGEES